MPLDLVVTLARRLAAIAGMSSAIPRTDSDVDAVEVAPLAAQAGTAGHHRGRPPTPSCSSVIVSGADSAISPSIMRSLVSCSRPSHPLGARRGLPARLRPSVHPPARQQLVAMAADPTARPGVQFEWIAGLPDRLEGVPGAASAGARLKRCSRRRSAARNWKVLVVVAEGQGGPHGPRPPTRSRSCAGRLADALVAVSLHAAASRSRPRPRRRPGACGRVEARALAGQFHDELADLVTGTIERWDAAETSESRSWNFFPRARSAVHPHQRHGGGEQAWDWSCTPSSWLWHAMEVAHAPGWISAARCFECLDIACAEPSSVSTSVLCSPWRAASWSSSVVGRSQCHGRPGS